MKKAYLIFLFILPSALFCQSKFKLEATVGSTLSGVTFSKSQGNYNRPGISIGCLSGLDINNKFGIRTGIQFIQLSDGYYLAQDYIRLFSTANTRYTSSFVGVPLEFQYNFMLKNLSVMVHGGIRYNFANFRNLESIYIQDYDGLEDTYDRYETTYKGRSTVASSFGVQIGVTNHLSLGMSYHFSSFRINYQNDICYNIFHDYCGYYPSRLSLNFIEFGFRYDLLSM